MKQVATLIAVRDMERSRRFYEQTLGLEVTADFGANVTLSHSIALQTAETWQGFIQGREIVFRHHAGELYFETDDMDGFLARLQRLEVEYVHPPLTHSWGQRVVRFYDPDGHMIEVGEAMTMVVRRFVAQGLSRQEIARRMDVPEGYVAQCLDR